jgi:hypothetical protein
MAEGLRQPPELSRALAWNRNAGGSRGSKAGVVTVLRPARFLCEHFNVKQSKVDHLLNVL